MMVVALSARELRKFWKSSPRRCVMGLRECFRKGRENEPGGISEYDLTIRDLAAHLIEDRHGASVGHGFIQEMFAGGSEQSFAALEASGAVSSTAFSNIAGQLIVNSVMQGFEREEFIATSMVPNQPTKLNGEKIPGITKLKDPEGDNADNLTVPEGMPYPHFGFGEDYIETPATTKRGLVVPVTREAIFFDRTNLVTERASQVGEILGYSKEKRLLDVWIGAVNNFKWKGVDYQTYYSATDAANWTNHLDGNDLLDAQDVDDAEMLFADMLEPNTGEPIVISGTRLLFVTPFKGFKADQIVNATEFRSTEGATTRQTVGPNPIRGRGIQVKASRLMYRRLVNAGVAAANAKATWFYGDPRAFKYMENWPITVVQSPTNSEAEFNQDIVMKWKASERGVAAVVEPRLMTRNRAVSTSSSSA